MAACSPPSGAARAPLGDLAPSRIATTQAPAGADAGTAADQANAPPAAAQAIASTRRDQRTLAAATPFQDRHGKAACADGDCNESEAGYKWAALHSLTDETRCAGLTANFIAGCRAYARDHRGQAGVAGASGGKG